MRGAACVCSNVCFQFQGSGALSIQGGQMLPPPHTPPKETSYLFSVLPQAQVQRERELHEKEQRLLQEHQRIQKEKQLYEEQQRRLRYILHV